MNLSRNCPICKNEISYKTVSQFNEATVKNRNCKCCSNRVRITKATRNNIKYSKNCIRCGSIHIFSTYTKYKNAKTDEEYRCKSCSVSITHTDKKINDETKLIISNSTKIGWQLGKYESIKALAKDRWSGDKNPMYASARFGELNPFYRKTHTRISREKMSNSLKNMSDDTKHRMSISAKLRVANTGLPLPNYNRTSIAIIEKYGIENGYNFQHAENGGEYKVRIGNICYFLDGYDSEKNVAIEYYESHHKKQIEKDMYRKTKIIEILNCKFIEIKEWELKNQD